MLAALKHYLRSFVCTSSAFKTCITVGLLRTSAKGLSPCANAESETAMIDTTGRIKKRIQLPFAESKYNFAK